MTAARMLAALVVALVSLSGFDITKKKIYYSTRPLSTNLQQITLSGAERLQLTIFCSRPSRQRWSSLRSSLPTVRPVTPASRMPSISLPQRPPPDLQSSTGRSFSVLDPARRTNVSSSPDNSVSRGN
ncbi:hypothetical protein PUN28_016943 [Cardiocondyla obscurior]|uniref:Uncharacterized protein n=1 Tax=Cardiocondyla obscurior TaxID=286306 RepID=A0AAW2EMB7_9HYME